MMAFHSSHSEDIYIYSQGVSLQQVPRPTSQQPSAVEEVAVTRKPAASPSTASARPSARLSHPSIAPSRRWPTGPGRRVQPVPLHLDCPAARICEAYRHRNWG